MSNTKMSITRALVRVKTIDSQITSITSGGVSGVVGVMVDGKIQGGLITDLEKFKQNAQRVVTSINALVDNRARIKAAIVGSNANTNVVINNVTMTVAEAIERKSFVDAQMSLYNAFRKTANNISTSINNHNAKISERLDTIIQNMAGKDRKLGDNEYNAVAAPYLKTNSAELHDPMDYITMVGKKVEELQTFMEEVDFVLSESNAKTEIEVELRD